MSDQTSSSGPVTIVVEHLDPELGAWSALEYGCIAREAHASGSRFLLSSVPTSLQMPEDLAATPGLNVEHRSVEEIFADRKSRVCLLDPSATVELSPADAETFDVFLFGGILDRTSELRKKGYAGRRLGPVQMTTDTAVRVTRLVVHDKIPLEEIKYVDHPEILINEHERTEMPFRYVVDKDGQPIMPPGMVDLIKKDADQVSITKMSTWALSTLLLLSPAAVVAKSAADYYIHSLPGAPDGPLLKMHAGHVEVDAQSNGHLFFWHYQNRHIANRQRTVVWLNGGPGCSSMDGALMEIGPYRLKDNHTLEYNEGSWDEFANLLFVDNPVGTGFSYVNTDSYIHELDTMAAQFVVFLEEWFKLFPEYESDDIYLAGESYAGQHIPYIAKAMQERNKNVSNSNTAQWRLKGLLIGNGWIAPEEQYMSYLPFAYEEGLIEEGSAAAKELEVLQSVCQSRLEAGKNRIHVNDCEKILNGILDKTIVNNQCYNMYDIRLRDSLDACGMNWPTDLVDVKPYLQREDVVAALHIDPAKKSGWTECSGAVSSNFNPQRSVPSVRLLPELLESGVEILLFSGEKDLICNHVGTEQLINNLKWGGGTGFETSPGVWAPRHDWTFEGEATGIYQYARNLTYVLIYNSSHMVPYDLPRQTRDMLDRFMNVDIASIGGHPTDSRIDGEKLPQTSVGGHPNSTAAEEQEKQRLKETEWKAYAKSGEAVLVVVIIGVIVWGFFIWRSRQRHHGYRGVMQKNMSSSSSVLERFQNKRTGGDVEAGDFDESELDDLHSPGLDREHYSVGEDSDEEEQRGEHSQHSAARGSDHL
ncbi:alpha/beta-hydrolase [Aspergillus uvarum CBS 121591]|uniref:Pheromone-processing carboxypeptidase KEX1 n=1 Tax=Aspergillus uvarum CBS 121591 TaxID=1448315 RepID=A0A319C0W6_9EURO|nr:alpha/beta-hydrolase [Aspergillus uvarum CBS 121591]PYH79666.1 alpha/beta-hydrolase [Aspergillus uvarum CBS 121591]